MKKVTLLTLALVLVLSMTLTGYANAAPGAEDGILIGFSLPSNQEERWTMDTAGIQSRCDELGYELTYAAADNDANKQYDQCMAMLTKGIDVLIIACIDANAASSIVEEAEKLGVPVIAYDRTITGTANLDAYVTFDSILTGEEQGRYIVKKLEEKYGEVKGNIVLLRGSPTDVCSALYFEGANNILGQYIDSGALNVILEGDCIDWKPEDATRHMENAISIAAGKGLEIDAVLAPNDGTANGVIAALGDETARKTILTGLDADKSACQRIVQGLQSSTIWGDTRELAKAAVNAASEWLTTGTITGTSLSDSVDASGNPIQVTEIRVPIVLLDSSNVDSIVESGYYTHEDLYGK